MGSEGQLRVLTVSDGRPFPVPSRREDTIGLLQSSPGSVTECRGKLGPVPEVGHPWGSQRAEVSVDSVVLLARGHVRGRVPASWGRRDR